MKFSLFFEMQLSEPTREAEAQIFQDCLAQAVLADELGYHAVWAVEHHGLREYSHSSAPEIFLSFVAARTRNVRIGHGVTLLPYRYNHPIRIAERIATLDILSGGRVNWGTGKSSSRVEQLAFESDIEALHAQYLEALEIIPRMWQEEVFEHHGKYFNIPPTQVVPKPIQQPHPPIFAACSRPETVRDAGLLGLGVLNFVFGGDAVLEQKVREYREAVASARVNRAKTNHFACAPATLVLPDDRRACELGFAGARFFLESLQRYYLRNDRPVGPLQVNRGPLAPDELADAMALRNTPGSPVATIIGDPEVARETVARYAAAGVDELLLVMQMGTIPHEAVMESIRTFAAEVMPAFADRAQVP